MGENGFTLDSNLPFGISAVVPHATADTAGQHWLEAAPVKSRSAHRKRLSEWISSRLALEIAFSNLGVTLDPKASRFVGYQTIAGLENWRFSLSHDDSKSIAWVVPAASAASIGVDLEPETREISGAVQDRFTSPHDDALSAISLWGIKEAAYKSLCQKDQEEFWLNSIEVKKDGTFTLPKRAVGRWSQKRSDGSLYSYAWR